MLTDKETYLEWGQEHVRKDKKIDTKELEDIQRELNGHCNSFRKIYKLGENWGHEKRIKENIVNKTCNAPPMYLTVKDHKEGPKVKTRAIVSSGQGMGKQLSSILSQIVRPIASNAVGSKRVISTEDMLAVIRELNESDDDKKNMPDNDDPTITSEDHTEPTSKSDLVNNSKSNDDLATPSPARGKVLSLIPDTDPGCDKEIINDYNINTVNNTSCIEPLRGSELPQPAQVPQVSQVPLPPSLQDLKDRVIAASDVEALYPSLDIRAVKKTIYKHTFMTMVEFQEVSFRDAAEYIAVCAKPWEVRL